MASPKIYRSTSRTAVTWFYQFLCSLRSQMSVYRSGHIDSLNFYARYARKGQYRAQVNWRRKNSILASLAKVSVVRTGNKASPNFYARFARKCQYIAQRSQGFVKILCSQKLVSRQNRTTSPLCSLRSRRSESRHRLHVTEKFT